MRDDQLPSIAPEPGTPPKANMDKPVDVVVDGAEAVRREQLAPPKAVVVATTLPGKVRTALSMPALSGHESTLWVFILFLLVD